MPSAVTLTIKREHIFLVGFLLCAGLLAWQNFFEADGVTTAELQVYKDSTAYYKSQADSAGLRAEQDLNEYITLRQQFDWQMQEVENIPLRYVPIHQNIMRLNADSTVKLLAKRLSIPIVN